MRESIHSFVSCNDSFRYRSKLLPYYGRDATPYLERNRVGRDAIDSAAALTDMGKYLFRERRLPVYDIAVAITKYDMCRRRKGGRCTKGTAGKILMKLFPIKNP
uniref:Uncharacterized protein n=1 Tax=Glossina brevipalpis TaxID=37001 RepID=A0A1A9WIS0_9MUSC